jgi:TP901 family phage tail tape measure protein
MAGFEVNEVLGATPGILNLAAAGQIDLATAADIASNVLGGMRLEVDQLNRVNDVLAATASRSNTTIEQLGQALSYAAPFAASAGVSIEEAAAAIGNMSDAGIQASRAGTGLIGVIRQLSNVTSGGEDVLAKYGLSLEDVDITARGLQPVLESLREVNLSTGDAIALFGSEAGAAAQVLVNQYSGAIDGAAGEAERMALVISDGLNPAIKSLQSGISEMTLQLGDSGLAGALENAIRSASGVVAVWNGMGEQFAEANRLTAEQAQQMQNTAGVASALAGAVGGVTATVGAMTAAKLAATAATKALTAAMALNPAVRLALGMATLAGAAYGARNAMVSLGDTQARLNDWARATWQVTAERFANVWDTAAAQATGAFNGLAKSVGGVASYLWNTFKALLNNIAGLARTSVNNVIASYATLGDAAVVIGRTFVDQFKNAFENVLNIGRGFSESLIAVLSGDFSFGAFNSAINEAIAQPFIGAFNEIAAAAQDNFGRDYLGEALTATSEAVRGFTGDVSDLAFRFRFAENEAGEAAKGMQEALEGLAETEIPEIPGLGIGGSGNAEDQQKEAERRREQLAQRIEALRESLLTEREIELERYAQQNEDLRAALEMELLTREEYDELKEEAHKAHVDRIVAMDEQAAKRREQLQREVANTEMQMRKDVYGLASGLLSTLGRDNKAFALASIALTKGLAIAQTIAHTQTASMLAYASQLVPGDPSSIGRAAAAALSVQSLGATKVGLIAATGLAEAAGVVAGGGGGGGVSSAGSVSSGGGGSVSQPAQQQAATPVGGTLTVQGISAGSLFTGEAVRELAEELIQYQKRGGTITIA